MLDLHLSSNMIYAEQMDAEGLVRKLLLTLWQPRKIPERLWVLCPHLTECPPRKHFRALSMPALQSEAACAKERPLGVLRQSVPKNGRMMRHPFAWYRYDARKLVREHLPWHHWC